ncbi:unnamed protein product [Lampetra fluviatilis]
MNRIQVAGFSETVREPIRDIATHCATRRSHGEGFFQRGSKSLRVIKRSAPGDVQQQQQPLQFILPGRAAATTQWRCLSAAAAAAKSRLSPVAVNAKAGDGNGCGGHGGEGGGGPLICIGLQLTRGESHRHCLGKEKKSPASRETATVRAAASRGVREIVARSALKFCERESGEAQEEEERHRRRRRVGESGGRGAREERTPTVRTAAWRETTSSSSDNNNKKNNKNNTCTRASERMKKMSLCLQ